MDKIDFFEVFFIDLVNEIKRPSVGYKGILKIGDAGYGPIPYIKHLMINFNNYSDIRVYQERLEQINKDILSKLEKELYENALWVVEFDLTQIIQKLEELKLNLNIQVATDVLPFKDIKFSNVGDMHVTDSIEFDEISTDIGNKDGRKIFKVELEEYASLFQNQIESLVIKIKWVFQKFSQNNLNSLKSINDISLPTVDKEILYDLLGKNQIEEALKLLLETFKGHKTIFNQLIMLSRRHSKNQTDKSMKIESTDDINLDENKIAYSIMELIDKLNN